VVLPPAPAPVRRRVAELDLDARIHRKISDVRCVALRRGACNRSVA
jgi:hypothetical protein